MNSEAQRLADEAKCREEFEAEFPGLPMGLSVDGTLYMNLTTRATWTGFRAAWNRRLASLQPADQARDARWWIGPEGQRMSPETFAAWAPTEPLRSARYRREDAVGKPQGEKQ